MGWQNNRAAPQPKETFMINIGPQYYRPPFPVDKYWEDDFKLMADSGLNTVQLWIVWAWVEARSGQFNFEDYDRLVEMVGKAGLQVVLSTIAAIHPYWIHREAPGSEMIDNAGRRVVSMNRGENHYGLTPGGCTDHPGVRERMGAFIRACGERYRSAPHLAGWDAWNELRWNVQAGGMVCYCDHTMAAYRKWLDKKYGGLDGLNEAWLRRYPDWEDVLPGRQPDMPFTDMIAFQEYITHRSNELALFRYETLKRADPDHTVTVHGGQPSVLHSKDGYPNTALHRGNDWKFAEKIDGIGCSSFPLMFGGEGKREMEDQEFFMRLESLRSAAGDKKIWISELQGGRGNTNFDLAAPVPAEEQQRWVWKGLSVGAEKILFWCWRDEVFGRESNGFGIIGGDGFKDERLAALKKTGDLLKKNEAFLDRYRADSGEVAILFSPASDYLVWAQEGSGVRYFNALKGYARALQELQITYSFVEENHLDNLNDFRLLFIPLGFTLPKAARKRIESWVEQGGVLVTEGETACFSREGFYAYPEDRWLTAEQGRRALGEGPVKFSWEGKDYALPSSLWQTPLDGGEELIIDRKRGKGRVIQLGFFPGEPAALKDLRPGLKGFLADLTDRLGLEPSLKVSRVEPMDEVHLVPGTSGDLKSCFLFFPKGTKNPLVSLKGAAGPVTDMLSGRTYPRGEFVLEELTWRMAWLAWQPLP